MSCHSHTHTHTHTLRPGSRLFIHTYLVVDHGADDEDGTCVVFQQLLDHQLVHHRDVEVYRERRSLQLVRLQVAVWPDYARTHTKGLINEDGSSQSIRNAEVIELHA